MSMKPNVPNGLTAKITRLVSKNKQLITGISIGALIILPTGLYIGERSANRQISDPYIKNEATEKENEYAAPDKAEDLIKQETTPTQNNTPATPQSTPQPTSTTRKDPCDYTAKNTAADKYAAAQLENARVLSKVLNESYKILNDPNTTLAEGDYRIQLDSEASAKKEAADDKAYNQYITDLQAAKCFKEFYHY